MKIREQRQVRKKLGFTLLKKKKPLTTPETEGRRLESRVASKKKIKIALVVQRQRRRLQQNGTGTSIAD